MISPRRLALLLCPLSLAACGSAEEEPAEPVSNPSEAAETQSAPSPQTAEADPEPASFARTMPQEMRGIWHKDILGRAPDAEECDPRLRGTVDWDRLITVRDTGYVYFEMSGRIMEVHNRTDTMIDATFDTTYADTPTSERRDFALQSDGTLAINLDDGDGTMQVVQYRRCPE